MEAAVAGVNRGGVARCSGFMGDSLPSAACGRRNLMLKGANRFHFVSRRGLRTVERQCLACSSIDFQDQSHLQSYLYSPCVRKGERLTNSVVSRAVADTAVEQSAWNETEWNSREAVMKAMKMEMKTQKNLRKASVVADMAVDQTAWNETEWKSRGAVMKAKKMEMKMQKKLRKAAMPPSLSHSSSSSESEADGENAKGQGGLISRGSQMEKLRRDWDAVSKTPLMNSIPVISSNFVIEQPQAQQVASPVADASDVLKPIVVEATNSVISSPSEAVQTYDRSGIGQALPIVLHDIYHIGRDEPSAASVEVCMGGRCKKAGAQEVLSAFQASGVTASACNKCMKKCKLAINVRVHQDSDESPQTYSGVGVEDVQSISQKHFGSGAGLRIGGWSPPALNSGVGVLGQSGSPICT